MLARTIENTIDATLQVFYNKNMPQTFDIVAFTKLDISLTYVEGIKTLKKDAYCANRISCSIKSIFCKRE